MGKWMKRIGLGFVCLLVVLLLSGALYQYISTKNDQALYPPPGKLVDIGGYRLHLHCSGQEGLTVVLDAGLGENSLDWAFVQPEIAKFARVCSYDRAGYGWSDESPLERTSQNIVDELHTLLKNAGEKGPYILVGHSFGGVNARLYASRYPDEVAGVVLVDASHEEQLEKMPDMLQTFQQGFSEKILFHHDLAPFWASIGVFRLLYHYSPAMRAFYEVFPSKIEEQYLAAQSTMKFRRASSQEAELFKESLKQLKDAGGFLGDKPLTVITAGKLYINESDPKEFTDRFAKVWGALQKDLVTKSTQGKQMTAEHSGHMITHEQPEMIVEAVREMVAEKR